MENNVFLFVCVEVLRPSQQLRSCRAGQLPINNQFLARTPLVVTDNYRWVITAQTTIFQYVQPRLPRDEALEKENRIDKMKK